MGRVQRYKKFKQCDPFAKKRAEVTDPKYNQPPSDVEDDFSGDEDGFGTGNIRFKEKKIKLETKKKQQDSEVLNSKLQQPTTAKNIKRSNKNDIDSSSFKSAENKNLSKRSLKRLRSKMESDTYGLAQAQHEFQKDLRESKHIKNVTGGNHHENKSVNSKNLKLEGRKEGESMRKFVTRVRKDAQGIMKETRNEASTTRKKKQEFLEQKKEKKSNDHKGKDWKRTQKDQDGYDDDDEFHEGGANRKFQKDNYLPTAPKASKGLHRVPEALMAPPQFSQSQLPRHCIPTKQKNKLNQQNQHQNKSSSSSSSISKDEMEKLRNRVIGSYKEFKEKKYQDLNANIKNIK